jgi:[CysO sulfur-carrier protein]-S-L-cysteine hydrolase
MISPDTIELPRNIVNQLLELSLNSPDKEICGLIASHNGQATRCYPLLNIAHKPSQQFQADPQQQINAMRHMREQDHTLFAIYHSHPQSPAIPSAADITQIQYPEALTLIISLHTTGTLQMRAYRSQSQQLDALNVAIIDVP